jgi:hypothetical protein
MKTLYSFLRRFSGVVCFLLLSTAASAQWTYVGTPGFSAGLGSYQSIVVGSDGTPYVAYNDQSFLPSGQAVVMKYDGSNWVPVGTPGFTAGMAEQGCITVDANDELYFSFQDAANSNRASVMHFNGSSWVYVGAPGFSTGSVTYTSLRADASGTLYCAYVDASSGRATVKTFNGTSWIAVGSTAEVSAGSANYTSLAIDPTNNMPWVVFTDGTNSNNATTVMYNGTAWVTVGVAGFTASVSGVLQTDIAFDAAGGAYVGYWDPFNSLKAGVRKFNGSSWSPLGATGISAGQAYFTSLVVNASGVPYITYMDYTAPGNAASTLEFDASTGTWSNLGVVGYSGSNPGYLESALDGNSSLYVTFVDGSNGNKVSVMKYALCTPGTVTSISPSTADVCAGDSVLFNVNGTLNDDTDWEWYLDSCGGTPVATGWTFMFHPSDTTVVYVRPVGGCSSSANCISAVINVLPAPPQPVISASGIVLTSSSALVYQWYFNQSPIPGENAQTHIATQTGFYSVLVTDANGCSSMSDTLFVLISGIAENAPATMELYPSVFTEMLQLTFHTASLHGWQLSLTDMTGRVVYSNASLQQNMSLDLHYLAPGMYTVVLESATGKVVKKVVKE